MEEDKILQRLLQEVQKSDGCFTGNHQRDDNDVYNMIENYQNHVKKQKLSNGKREDASIIQQSRNTSNAMSHSQPCLYSIGDRPIHTENFLHHIHSSDPQEDNNNNTNDSSNIMMNCGEDADGKKILSQNVDQLRNENVFLKRQIQELKRKTNKLRQLELAYSRIEQEFEEMVSQREKHEKLEKAALHKLEQQIHCINHRNQILQERNDELNQRILTQQQQQRTNTTLSEPINEKPDFSALRNTAEEPTNDARARKIAELNTLLNELVPKNKELLAIEERQRIELDAQRTTLEEQRTYIEMLEKAVSNAQERLSAKDRQALDAVAVMDKCAHLQKLLQESLDEKQKRQEENAKQTAQLEMELAQLRLQLSKDSSLFGHRKGAKSPENEEIMKLKKVIYGKDERISQLENSLLNIQRRYNEELQRNNPESMDLLREKVAVLESENTEKEQRIQELTDENQLFHDQWTEERRSLDSQVRLLEQNLNKLMTGDNGVSISAYTKMADIRQASPYLCGDRHLHRIIPSSNPDPVDRSLSITYDKTVLPSHSWSHRSNNDIEQLKNDNSTSVHIHDSGVDFQRSLTDRRNSSGNSLAALHSIKRQTLSKHDSNSKNGSSLSLFDKSSPHKTTSCNANASRTISDISCLQRMTQDFSDGQSNLQFPLPGSHYIDPSATRNRLGFAIADNRSEQCDLSNKTNVSTDQIREMQASDVINTEHLIFARKSPQKASLKKSDKNDQSVDKELNFGTIVQLPDDDQPTTITTPDNFNQTAYKRSSQRSHHQFVTN